MIEEPELFYPSSLFVVKEEMDYEYYSTIWTEEPDLSVALLNKLTKDYILCLAIEGPPIRDVAKRIEAFLRDVEERNVAICISNDTDFEEASRGKTLLRFWTDTSSIVSKLRDQKEFLESTI